jgi:muconate cycloisomerase
MKISNLRLFIVELPFRFSFKHSLAKRSQSHNLIVEATIETNKGKFVGYGEGIPREYVTGETIEQASNHLNMLYFAQFLGQQFANSSELLTHLQKQFRYFGLEERSNGASWCALELALLDAAGKANSLPVADLLKEQNLINSVSSVPACNSIKYGATASLTSLKKLALLLTFFRLYGFSTVKLKLGKDITDAVNRVKLARKIMGHKAILRVDANCAWSVPATIEFSHKVKNYNIASIEQPLPANELNGLCTLASSIPQAIVLDESLCTTKQAQYFADKKIKVDFNIRISKVGGLIAANNIKNIANQAGIPCHLGAQVGESGILTTAGRIFALNNGPFVNYEGSANSFLLKHDLTEENLTFGYGGHGSLPISNFKARPKAGLGITVDQNKLINLIKQQMDSQFSLTPPNTNYKEAVGSK